MKSIFSQKPCRLHDHFGHISKRALDSRPFGHLLYLILVAMKKYTTPIRRPLDSDVPYWCI